MTWNLKEKVHEEVRDKDEKIRLGEMSHKGKEGEETEQTHWKKRGGRRGSFARPTQSRNVREAKMQGYQLLLQQLGHYKNRGNTVQTYI